MALEETDQDWISEDRITKQEHFYQLGKSLLQNIHRLISVFVVQEEDHDVTEYKFVNLNVLRRSLAHGDSEEASELA